MSFLLTAEGIAPRGADGAAFHAGGSNIDSVAPEVSGPAITGLSPVAVASAGTTLYPGYADLAAAGFAPQALATDHKWVLPDQGEILETGFAPVVMSTAHLWVLPDTSAIIATGFAPIAFLTDHKRVFPSDGQLALTGLQPDVLALADWFAYLVATDGVSLRALDGFPLFIGSRVTQTISPGISSLLLDGMAAAVVADESVVLQAGHGQIDLAGLTPVVGLSEHRRVLPVQSEIIVTGLGPEALTPRAAVPGISGLIFTGFAPLPIRIVRASPGVSDLTKSGFVPVIVLPRTAFPGVSSLSSTGLPPTPAATANRFAASATSVIVLSAFNPAISADASIVTAPQSSGLVISGMTPIPVLPRRTNPAISAILVAGLQPILVNPRLVGPLLSSIAINGFISTISAPSGRFAHPDASELAATGFAPAFVAPQSAWPQVGTLAFSGHMPLSASGQSVRPALFQMDLDSAAAELVITEDQFARLAEGEPLAMDGFNPFIVLPRVMFADTCALILAGSAPLSHAIIPVALMDFVARAGEEMTGQIVKHPWSEIRVAVDWRPYATRQQTMIVASEWVETTELGMVFDGAFVSNNVASVEVGGGVQASISVVENRVMFADGSRDVFRVRVHVAGVA